MTAISITEIPITTATANATTRAIICLFDVFLSVISVYASPKKYLSLYSMPPPVCNFPGPEKDRSRQAAVRG